MPKHATSAVDGRTHHKMVTVEIRPSEGGDDAALFASEIADVLTTHARRHHCPVTVTGTDRTIVLTFTGDNIHQLKLTDLAGTHRIQRVPVNDTRRHTSTVNVVVLTNRHEQDVTVNRSDLEIIPFKGSGPGGQHRNKSFTCVRVRHIPSGVEAVGTRHRSQRQNLNDAIDQIRVRLQQVVSAQTSAKVNGLRHAQTETGPVKQFTWNTQRDEVIDHTNNRRWPLRKVLKGRIG